MAAGVDGDDLGVDPDVEPEAVEEPLGGLQEQIILVFDHAAHEIGQSAVGVGHMARALDHRDGGRLVEASQARGRRHPAGDAADDHDPASHVHVQTFTSRSGPGSHPAKGLAHSRAGDRLFSQTRRKESFAVGCWG